MLDMVIAECPRCQTKKYSWSEEDALAKLDKHECLAKVSDRRLSNILVRVLKKLKSRMWDY